MNTDSILEKIKKLIALANDNATGSEEERDAAMKMVQKLLIKYRLTMADVSSTEKDETIVSQTYRFYGAPWIRTVFGAISRMNFCKYYYMRDTTSNNHVLHVFTGATHEVEATIELCKAIQFSCEKEGSKGARINSHDKSYKRSFLNVCSSTISNRVNIMIQEEIEFDENSTGTSLVVKNAYEMAEIKATKYLEEQGIKLRIPKRVMTYRSGRGYQDGKNYGNSVNLSSLSKIVA